MSKVLRRTHRSHRGDRIASNFQCWHFSDLARCLTGVRNASKRTSLAGLSQRFRASFRGRQCLSLRNGSRAPVSIDRLQGSDAGELDRAAMFGCVRQKVGSRQYLRHVAFGFGNELGEVRNGIPQCRQLAAILQHDRLGKTLIPGHDATPATEPRIQDSICVRCFAEPKTNGPDRPCRPSRTSAAHDAPRSALYRLIDLSNGQTQKSARLVGEYSDGREDEREIEVTSVTQLGSRFLLRNSKITLHLQQWNRLDRAARNSFTEFQFNRAWLAES
jgi:hypothetical protein